MSTIQDGSPQQTYPVDWTTLTKDYMNKSKGPAEFLSLTKKVSQLIKYFRPGAPVDGLIKGIGSALKFRAPTTTIKKLTSVLTADNPEDVLHNILGMSEAGYNSVKLGGELGLFSIPHWIESLAIGASCTSLLSSAIDIKQNVEKIINSNERIDKIQAKSGSGGIHKRVARLKSEKNRDVAAMKVAKAVLKIIVGLAGLFTILSGAAVVPGIVLLVLSTIATSISIISHFYDESKTLVLEQQTKNLNHVLI